MNPELLHQSIKNKGKIRTWDSKPKLTRQTRPVAAGFVSGTVPVYDVVPPSVSTTKVYQSRTKPLTSRVGARKTPAFQKPIYVLSVEVVIRILRLILRSITPGKWLGWAKRKLIKLYSLAISTVKRTGKPKKFTGSRNLNKISTLDSLYAYGALVFYMGMVIRPEVIPDTLSRLVIISLSSHLIIRRFR